MTLKLTTSSYAILGLLDVRDWTAYDLAQQANRSLAFAWPVSESQLYAEPKRLAAAGLITITQVPAGPERRRQVYSIAAAGRRELQQWLATEPAEPRLHAEVMLRCLFAPSGTLDDLEAGIRSTRAAVLRSYLAGQQLVEEYVGGDNPFPERTHANLLWMTLVRDLQMMLLDWADDALAVVSQWDDTVRGGDPRQVEERLAQLTAPGRERGLHP